MRRAFSEPAGRAVLIGLLSAAWAGLAATGPVPCAADEPPLPAGAEAGEPALPAGARDANEPALPAGAGAEEPGLPAGAEDEGEPALPTTEGPGEPPPPIGIEDADEPAARREESWLRQVGLTGFLDVRGGVRTQRDSHEKDASLGEARLQLDLEKTWRKLTFKLTADLVYDPVLDHHSVRLETGQGLVDLRRANVSFSPLPFLDVKLGRQILTWGTGDLLFLNDLFPKDWQAFFIGRDVEYLKAPSDAAKIGLFTEIANLNVVFTPRFDADRFLRGRRISYWNSSLSRRAGRDAVVEADPPETWFRDHEWAARLSKNLGGYELAGYGYWGYWKSPGGFDPRRRRATFPRLSVYGASVRGQVGRGIGSVEAAYYDSRQDRGGGDPFVNNSQLRFLVGYEQDLSAIVRDLTAGVQYYVEWMMDHDRYARALRGMPPGMRRADEDRHVLTFRVTKLLLNQNLTLSLFAYWSPTDADAYLRPNVKYKIDDHWTVEVGGNVFLGREEHTFFGQFERNTNLYTSLRYSF